MTTEIHRISAGSEIGFLNIRRWMSRDGK